MGWIQFFDGDCAFCSRSVRHVARFDKRGRIGFAPLQGELGRRLGFSRHAENDGGTMVVLRERDGAVFLRSDALLELARAMGGAWRLFGIFRCMPKSLRDRVYDRIAKNRHRFFGESERCSLSDPAVRARLRS